MSNEAIDSVIKSLNERKTVQAILPDNLADFALSPEEESLIKSHKPYQALIIYGSLAPGRPNHKVVEPIKGEWKAAVIKGRLEEKGWGAEMGFFGFAPADAGEQSAIDCHVLISEALIDNWALLDEFEGDGYRRILAKYELPNGCIGVGYIYALSQN